MTFIFIFNAVEKASCEVHTHWQNPHHLNIHCSGGGSQFSCFCGSERFGQAIHRYLIPLSSIPNGPCVVTVDVKPSLMDHVWSLWTLSRP